MDAKEFLKQIERDDRRIESKITEVYQLRCLATNVTAPMGREPIQSSDISDKVGKTVAKIVDLENEINRLIDNFVDDKQQRINVIEQVVDPLLYSILHKHYVAYKSFSTIAEELHYSTVWISRKHTEALAEVQKVLDEKEGSQEVS